MNATLVKVTTKVETPEDCLRKAMAAKTARVRGLHARRGLAKRGGLEKTTHAMLLRQLYLSLFEGQHFDRALEVAKQALTLDVLTDVLAQDAARAAIAAGYLDEGLLHLRAAARRGPASRRPFHLWTLGSALFLAGRHREAVASLERAARWGTSDKPLYRAHLALAKLACGEPIENIERTIHELAEAPCGQGYGRFLLGHLAYAAGDGLAAQRYLEAFVKRTESSRPGLAIALRGELIMARTTLAKMQAN